MKLEFEELTLLDGQTMNLMMRNKYKNPKHLVLALTLARIRRRASFKSAIRPRVGVASKLQTPTKIVEGARRREELSKIRKVQKKEKPVIGITKLVLMKIRGGRVGGLLLV